MTLLFKNMRLANGLPWSLPITLAVDHEKATELNIGETINLVHKGKNLWCNGCTGKVFLPDKRVEAEMVYRTMDMDHAGVSKLFGRSDVYIAGPITLVKKDPKKASLPLIT
ncbi:hypothetical protein GCM10020331_074780 [Ectobacillus funiculus]